MEEMSQKAMVEMHMRDKDMGYVFFFHALFPERFHETKFVDPGVDEDGFVAASDKDR